MLTRLFTFVQMEFPWALGPADGRYLLRKTDGLDENEPQHVVVLGTVGAERRGLLGGRSRTRRAGRAGWAGRAGRAGRAGPESSRVPVARATVVDPIPLSTDSQARAWLSQLDPERETLTATRVVNRVLFAHRIAAATPHVHEVSPTQALVVRAGYGEGEQVADGLWRDARELLLSPRLSRRRASVLRPQERLAVLLSGRGRVLLCEELTLRARLDLDAGRLALAAIELERAYAAALGELPAEGRSDLRERIGELEGLLDGVERNARVALPEAPPASNAATDPTACTDTAAPGGAACAGARAHAHEHPYVEPDRPTVTHALERLEAALRARTASGFSSPN